MMNIIKAGMIAIALTATTAVMAQTTETTANDAQETRAQAPACRGHWDKSQWQSNDTTAMKHHRPHGEQKMLTCPNCGTEIAMPHHKRVHHRGNHGNMGPDWSKKNFKPQPDAEIPEVGTKQDTLPHGAIPYVKDGKQKFGARGVEYEPTVENGKVKFTVTGKMEMR